MLLSEYSEWLSSAVYFELFLTLSFIILVSVVLFSFWNVILESQHQTVLDFSWQRVVSPTKVSWFAHFTVTCHHCTKAALGIRMLDQVRVNSLLSLFVIDWWTIWWFCFISQHYFESIINMIVGDIVGTTPLLWIFHK